MIKMVCGSARVKVSATIRKQQDSFIIFDIIHLTPTVLPMMNMRMFIFPTIPPPGLPIPLIYIISIAPLAMKKFRQVLESCTIKKNLFLMQTLSRTGSDTYGDTPQEVYSCWTIRACEQRNVLVIVREL